MKIYAPGEPLSGSHWGLEWKDGEAECPEGDLLNRLLERGYILTPDPDAKAETPDAQEEPQKQEPPKESAEPKKKRATKKTTVKGA